ncbi:cleavage stimulation factor subunit 1 [Galendromus occidentalis]|uniref:Cleavage stimulation factor 50 kDa subunit n=1 Tax=Galendromus occidentalis TaxID=34638 RepID=A0AAJ7SI90_9ACAR|nr:cleavage stimulation factor subunit 1 [Galendromus occidentalis]
MLNPEGSPTVEDRETLYKLMISQLYYDGHQELAASLIAAAGIRQACPPSDKLLHVMRSGLQSEADRKGLRLLAGHASEDLYTLGPSLDLEFETESTTFSPDPAQYETLYVTSHKSECRAGAFNADGTLLATGSVDSSIKILSVERILTMNTAGPRDFQLETIQKRMETHPVIRILYDHDFEVTTLAFHPRQQILASGSRDFTIKIFDFTRPSTRRALKAIRESEPVSFISFHPNGDYMLVAANHPVVRLYDVNTTQCFVSSVPSSQHTDVVNMVNWSKTGRIYASCSTDGSIKIWDGVSNKCVATYAEAHAGAEVCSVYFTRNGKYLLSSGRDSSVKLWELSASRCLISYTGAGATGKQEFCSQAVFNHTEDYVLFPDENTGSLCSWNSRDAQRQDLVDLGHKLKVRYICHSPTKPAFLTCSDDHRARFWFRRSVITNR